MVRHDSALFEASSRGVEASTLPPESSVAAFHTYTSGHLDVEVRRNCKAREIPHDLRANLRDINHFVGPSHSHTFVASAPSPGEEKHFGYPFYLETRMPGSNGRDHHFRSSSPYSCSEEKVLCRTSGSRFPSSQNGGGNLEQILGRAAQTQIACASGGLRFSSLPSPFSPGAYFRESRVSQATQRDTRFAIGATRGGTKQKTRHHPRDAGRGRCRSTAHCAFVSSSSPLHSDICLFDKNGRHFDACGAQGSCVCGERDRIGTIGSIPYDTFSSHPSPHPLSSSPSFSSGAQRVDRAAGPDGRVATDFQVSRADDHVTFASVRASLSSCFGCVWLCVSIVRAGLAVYLRGVLDCLSVHRFLVYCFRSPVICQKSISCLLLNGGLFLGLIQFFTHILMPVIATVSSFLICFIATLVSLFSSYATATEEHASSSALPLSPATPANAADLPPALPLLSFDVLSPLFLALFSFFPALSTSRDIGVSIAASKPALGSEVSPLGFHALPTTAAAAMAAGGPGAETVAWLVPLIECTLWSLFRFLVLYPLYCCNSLFNALWYRDIADTAAALLLQDEETLRRERTKHLKERKEASCRVSFVEEAQEVTCLAFPRCVPRSGDTRDENKTDSRIKTELVCEEKERMSLSSTPLLDVFDRKDASTSCSSLSSARPVSVAAEGSHLKLVADPDSPRSFSSCSSLQERKMHGQRDTCMETREATFPIEGSSANDRLFLQDSGLSDAAKGRSTETGSSTDSRLRKLARAFFEGRHGTFVFSNFFREEQCSSSKNWEGRNESEPENGWSFFTFFSQVCALFSPSEQHAFSTVPPVSPSAFYSASFFSSSPCPPAVEGPSSGGVSPCEFVLRLLLHYVWWIGASVVLPLIPFIGPPLSLINLSWLFAFYCFDWHDYLPYTSFSPCGDTAGLPSATVMTSVDMQTEYKGGTGCRGPQNGEEDGDCGRCRSCFCMREEQRLHRVSGSGCRWSSQDGQHNQPYQQSLCFSLSDSRGGHPSVSSTSERRLLGLRVSENDSLYFSSFSLLSPFSAHLSASRPAPSDPRQVPLSEAKTLGDRRVYSVGRARRGPGQVDAVFPGSEREEGEEVFARRVNAWVESQQKSLKRLKHNKTALSPQMHMRIQRLAALFSTTREGNAQEKVGGGERKEVSGFHVSKTIRPAGDVAPRDSRALSGSERRSFRLRSGYPGREAPPTWLMPPSCNTCFSSLVASQDSPPGTVLENRGSNAEVLFRDGEDMHLRRAQSEERNGTTEEACQERRILFVGEMRSRVKYFEEHWLYFAGFGLPLCLVQFVCSSFVDYGVLSMLFPVCIVTSLHALPLRWVSRSDESLLEPYALFRRLPIFAPIQLLTRYMLRVVVRHFAKDKRKRDTAKFCRK